MHRPSLHHAVNEEVQVFEEKHLCTADQRLLLKQDKDYIVDKEGVNYRRFEYYLYQKVSRMLDSNHIFVNESAKNKRLEDDLIPITEWKKNEYLVANTGLDKLIAPIEQTLATLTKSVRHKMAQVSRNINDGAKDFVIHQPRTNQLTWKLANKRWKDDLDNPIYNQLQHMGIMGSHDDSENIVL